MMTARKKFAWLVGLYLLGWVTGVGCVPVRLPAPPITASPLLPSPTATLSPSQTPTPTPAPTATATLLPSPTPLAFSSDTFHAENRTFSARIPQGWQVQPIAEGVRMDAPDGSAWLQVSVLNTALSLTHTQATTCASDWLSYDVPDGKFEPAWQWVKAGEPAWWTVGQVAGMQVYVVLQKQGTSLVRMDWAQATGGDVALPAPLQVRDWLSASPEIIAYQPAYALTYTYQRFAAEFAVPICWRKVESEQLTQFRSPDNQMVLLWYQDPLTDVRLAEQTPLLEFTIEQVRTFLPAKPEINDPRRLMPDGSERMNFVLTAEEISGEIYYQYEPGNYTLFGAFWKDAVYSAYLPIYSQIVLSFRDVK